MIFLEQSQQKQKVKVQMSVNRSRYILIENVKLAMFYFSMTISMMNQPLLLVERNFTM